MRRHCTLALALVVVATALIAPSQAQAVTLTLSIDFGGKGTGTVTSTPAGINCTVTAGVEAAEGCSHTFTSEGQVSVSVVLTPAPGSLCVFQGNPALSCGGHVITSPSDDTFIADFGAFILTTHALTVSKTGDGSGKVTSSPAGIDCGAACSKTYDYGTKVTLTATPDAGAVFNTWTGACNGQGATCTLAINQATSTNAVFGLAGAPTPTAPTTPTPPTGGQTGVAAVEAEVVAASAGRSRLGKRIVRLELSLQENVSATLTLVRRGTTLATKQIATVKAGERVLTLRVPAGTASGRATLRFELRDEAGNTVSGQRRVRIGKP